MKVDKLYDKILIKSRNLNLYKTCNINDSLQNKIILLLVLFSFVFNKLKKKNLKFTQNLFDYIFLKIETDLREIGFGDIFINKKMKMIINKFYSILLNFKDFDSKRKSEKLKIIVKLLDFNSSKSNNSIKIVKFCETFAKMIDLTSPDDIYKAKFK